MKRLKQIKIHGILKKECQHSHRKWHLKTLLFLKNENTSKMKFSSFYLFFLTILLFIVFMIEFYKSINGEVCNFAHVIMHNIEKTCWHLLLFKIILNAWITTHTMISWMLWTLLNWTRTKMTIHLHSLPYLYR